MAAIIEETALYAREILRCQSAFTTVRN